jgi:DNA repair protein RecO (recombination protein O)
VLRGRAYGEGHRLFSLLTREHGKIVAVAKGVQKPRAKLAGALQPFTLATLTLSGGERRNPVITGAHVEEGFYPLRTHLEHFAYASYFAELFDTAVEEHEPARAAFDLLVGALHTLVAGEEPRLLARYVEISLAAVLGYQPELTHCTNCGVPLAPAGADGVPVWPTWLGFSAGQGGALCSVCLDLTPGAKRVAAGTVQVADLLLTRGLGAVARVPISERLGREIENTFREYLEYRLERRIESARFLHAWTDPAPVPAGVA